MFPPNGIPTIDPDDVLSAARHQLGMAGGTLRSWRWQSLWTPRLASTSGVYRIDWVIESGGVMLEGSLVLKVLARADPHVEPREADLYASGILDHLPAGLRAPRWHGTVELGLDHIGVWLDVEQDDPDAAWDIERFGIAARHLGRLAGTLQPALLEQAGKRPVRSFWNNTAYIEETLRAFSDAAGNDLVRRAWPEPTRRALLRLWERRGPVLERAEHLPVTLCHGDAQRRNLFAHRHTTVAIDWANFGMAPVGMDIATLVHYALAYFDIAMEDAMDLERSVLNGYTLGLEDEGTSIDRDTIWIGYATQVIFLGLLETGPVLRLTSDPGSHERAEVIYGQPIDAIMDRRRAIAGYLLGLGSRMERGDS
jgi:hypothetical protein